MAAMRAGLMAAVNRDDVDFLKRSYPREENNYLLYFGGLVFVWVTGVALVCALMAIILSLALYNLLAAANFPSRDDHELLKDWIKIHYPFFIMNLLLTVASAFLQTFSFYYLGLMRFPA